MNTKTRTTLIIAAVLSALLLALTALAAGDGDNRPGPGYGYHALSPEQQKAFLDIRQKHEKVLFDLHQKLAQKRAELDAVMAAQQPDEKRVKGLSADVGKLMGDLYSERSAMAVELRKAGLPDYGSGRGWHARQGYGGYGPGMMGGYGYGGYGMGPGMMGPGYGGYGYGMGPGMMGPGYGGYGYGGMGPGMMYGPDPDDN